MKKTNVYFAACHKDGGIYHYRTDEKGAMEFVEKIPVDRPMYLAIADGRMYVIIRDAGDGKSGMFSYAIGEDGRLSDPTAIESTRGIVACHLWIDGDDAYAVNYLSGNVIKMPDTLSVHEGKGPHPTRQEAPHTHYVCTTPDGKYVLNTDLGLDTIFVCDRNLNPVSEAKVPAGSGCRHLIFSEDGTKLYCVNELSNTVSVFRYSDGTLVYLNSYEAIPAYFADRSTSAAIRISGDYLYTSNRTHDSISCFRCVGETLELMSITPCGGKSPRDFDLLGNLLFCTNEADDSVTIFRVSGSELTRLETRLTMPNPLCVVFGATV